MNSSVLAFYVIGALIFLGFVGYYIYKWYESKQPIVPRQNIQVIGGPPTGVSISPRDPYQYIGNNVGYYHLQAY